jgi:hypothetical protein
MRLAQESSPCRWAKTTAPLRASASPKSSAVKITDLSGDEVFITLALDPLTYAKTMQNTDNEAGGQCAPSIVVLTP